MRYLIFVGALSLTSCFSPTFVPRTAEGARCKKECATSMASCQGSSYTCDKANNQCVESCIELENTQQ